MTWLWKVAILCTSPFWTATLQATMYHFPKCVKFGAIPLSPCVARQASSEELFPLVRRINHKVPPERRLRMLAGDPPLDWSKVKSNSEIMLDRDANIAS